MGLVKIQKISLYCNNIKSKKKIYHLGLIKVDPKIIEKFNYIKKNYYDKVPLKFREKDELKLFQLDKIFNYKLHSLTLKPILFYYRLLEKIQNKLIYNYIPKNNNSDINNIKNIYKQSILVYSS